MMDSLIRNVSYRDPAVAAFVVIPVTLAAVFTWGAASAWRRGGGNPAFTTRHALLAATGAAVWMAATWLVAESGVLREWQRMPPPFVLLVLSIIAVSVLIAFSGLGRRLATHVPLWALVAVQAFRLPLEVAMHAMYERGIMPEQMSYSGRNFDIVTGATAIVVAMAVAAGRGGTLLVAAWNVMGLALLVNVVTVAILSTPFFRLFGDDRLNVWVTYTPFVWLPAVMVLAALTGHLLIFRALSLQRQKRPA